MRVMRHYDYVFNTILSIRGHDSSHARVSTVCVCVCVCVHVCEKTTSFVAADSLPLTLSQCHNRVFALHLHAGSNLPASHQVHVRVTRTTLQLVPVRCHYY